MKKPVLFILYQDFSRFEQRMGEFDFFLSFRRNGHAYGDEVVFPFPEVEDGTVQVVVHLEDAQLDTQEIGETLRQLVMEAPRDAFINVIVGGGIESGNIQKTLG